MKLFIGPVSLNTIDSTIEFSEENKIELGLIPSRRQVDYDGGYVENLTTKTLKEYVSNKTNKVKIFRDHGGEAQGKTQLEDTFMSFYEDSLYFDFIHLDPFYRYKDLNTAILKTVEYLKFCEIVNPKILFEISTEQTIREISPEELDLFVQGVKKELSENQFNKIKYLVIQCGTKLKDGKNTGEYDEQKLIKMIDVSKKHNLLPKEHNGDYQSFNIIKEKFKLGLSCINIAPEFGVIETSLILEYLDENSTNELFQICFESGKWKKWVSKDFQPEIQKKELIKICGHYVYSYQSFKELKNKYLPKSIDDEIKNKLKLRIKEIVL